MCQKKNENKVSNVCKTNIKKAQNYKTQPSYWEKKTQLKDHFVAYLTLPIFWNKYKDLKVLYAKLSYNAQNYKTQSSDSETQSQYDIF